MLRMTAKELKHSTGEALRRVRQGESILITRRGKPVAVLSPAGLGGPEAVAEPEAFWKDVEQTLRSTEPRFESAEEALRWSRRRP